MKFKKIIRRNLIPLGLTSLFFYAIFGWSAFDFPYGYTPYPSPNGEYYILMTQTFSEKLAQGTFGTARVFNKSGELICKEGVEFIDPLWVKDEKNGNGLYVGDVKHNFFCPLPTSPE